MQRWQSPRTVDRATIRRHDPLRFPSTVPLEPTRGSVEFECLRLRVDREYRDSNSSLCCTACDRSCDNQNTTDLADRYRAIGSMRMLLPQAVVSTTTHWQRSVSGHQGRLDRC